MFSNIFSVLFSFQVNGIDVSSLPHEDAVQVFLNAPEPIVVELKRRNAGSDSAGGSSTTSSNKSSESVKHSKQIPSTPTTMTTTAVQTEPLNYLASTHPEPDYEVQEFLYDESPTSDHQDDECLPPDIDIEVGVESTLLLVNMICFIIYIWADGENTNEVWSTTVNHCCERQSYDRLPGESVSYNHYL